MTKHTLLVIALPLCLIATTSISAQGNGQAPQTKIISLKIRKAEADEAVQEYFNQVFPTASRHGFKAGGSLCDHRYSY